jgi:hypothetical protein
MLSIRRCWPLAFTLVLGFLLAPAVRADPARADTQSVVESNVVRFLESQLRAYAGSEGPFVEGVWTSPENACWACNNGGPATGAAALYVLTGRARPEFLSESKQTIEMAIATRQNADGSFTGPPTNTESPGITTMFFGVEFGTVYRLLANSLSTEQRERWQRSLAAAANFLITHGDTKWYANGNINLGYTEFLYLVWQATGEARFEQAYEESWVFTAHPPQSRFPGGGWVTVAAPSREDGADGSGYLAETGEGGTGFDPEYASLQLDMASRLYLLSHDRRALRLANMLVNLLMPRINTTTWLLNTSGGTRHTQEGRQVGFIASAFAVLGFAGLRPELTSYVLPQITTEENWYPLPGQGDSGVFRRAFGADVATIALAAAGPTGLPAQRQPGSGVTLARKVKRTSLKAPKQASHKIAKSHHRRPVRRHARGARSRRGGDRRYGT